VNKFGEALRRFRNASNDPERENKRLSQERLGELIGRELGDYGYSGAAISEWELGKSKPNAHDRRVVIALVHVLYECGGVKTLTEADQFLERGNYRALDEEESHGIFPDLPDEMQTEQAAPNENITEHSRSSWLADILSISQDELKQIFDKAREDGPEPSWPRGLAALMRKATDGFSLSMSSILWIAVWLLTIWSMSPSLKIPFASYDSAFIALCMCAGGSLVIPLFIGILVNTKSNEYWRSQSGVSSFLLRLYTYQGAGVGFNVGYFLVFPLSLIRYYMGFSPATWIEVIAATVAVILGNMGARVVPHNLWLAYKRLTLRDGWIFFVVALMGPLWAFFFLEFYSTLLHPVLGIIVILLALSGVVLIAQKSSQKQTA
jgi:transcriptional regulator with XRE-family HTH domain